jgi:hypothetical protein
MPARKKLRFGENREEIMGVTALLLLDDFILDFKGLAYKTPNRHAAIISLESLLSVVYGILTSDSWKRHTVFLVPDAEPVWVPQRICE